MMPARPLGRQMLGHVVHEQHFAPLGFNRKTVVRTDAPLRRHERRIREDHVGILVPLLIAGQRVVFEDVRLRKAVQVHVHERQTYHIRRDVVAADVVCELSVLVGC